MTEQKHIHFIGICGTAMGSVAAAIKERGYRVTGSDANVYPPMSTFLEGMGIEIYNGYAAKNIPDSPDLIVVGNAISRGNPELEAVLEKKLLYASMPEVLKNILLQGKRNLVVTGTHGKTTTSSMLAWLLRHAGTDPSFLIGGIPKNLKKGAYFTDSPCVVLEGDEYDTAFFDKRSKFLHYLPEVVIVNNIEFDHADIFDSIDDIKLTFRRLLNIVPRNGLVLVNADDPNSLDVVQNCPAPVKTIGFTKDADMPIENVRYLPGSSTFDLDGISYTLEMDGEFNVRNAAMAITASRFCGVDTPVLQEGIMAFEGVTRRQELRGEKNGVKVIDDFGHHPTAITQTLRAIRQRYPQGSIWAVFEPRSNTSRRNIFQNELPEALGHADGIVLAPVANPEKVPESDRLRIDKVVETLVHQGKHAFCEPTTEAIVNRLASETKAGDTIVVLSNGGFDGIHDKLLAAL